VVTFLLALLAFQPAPAMLRSVFEGELARVSAAYGPADPRTARAARDLGLFLAQQGDASAARAPLARAVRIAEAALGRSAPATLADVAELAAVSEPAESESLWQRASTSPDSALAARAFGALGDLRENLADRPGAIRFYRMAVQREEAAPVPDQLRIASRLNTLALALKPREAVPLLERALRIIAGRLGPRRVESASIQINLAARLLAAGRRKPALSHAAEAVSVFEEALGPEHPRTAAARDYLRRILGASGSEAP
jgi:tetratricopeptide (TPR) repeat protein